MIPRRPPISLLLAASSVGLIFSACVSFPTPDDGSGGSGGSGGSTDGSSGGGGGGSGSGGSGGGSGGAICLFGPGQDCGLGGSGGGSAGESGLGGLGGLGGGASSASCECGETWTLECYCAEFDCPTFEEAIDDPYCSGGVVEEIVTGCGQVTVHFNGGFNSSTYVYAEDDHELISASHGEDVGGGPCGTFGYSGGILDVEACADEDTDLLCP